MDKARLDELLRELLVLKAIAGRRIVIVHGPTADAKHGTSVANVT